MSGDVAGGRAGQEHDRRREFIRVAGPGAVNMRIPPPYRAYDYGFNT